MPGTEQVGKRAERERRLALAALCGDDPGQAGPCLDAEELAALVEQRLPPGEVDAALAHLSGCAACYAVWCQLDAEVHGKESAPGRLLRFVQKPRVLAAAGSALAAAASVALFLNIAGHTPSTVLEPPRPAELGIPLKADSALERKGADRTADVSVTVQEEGVALESPQPEAAGAASPAAGERQEHRMQTAGRAADATGASSGGRHELVVPADRPVPPPAQRYRKSAPMAEVAIPAGSSGLPALQRRIEEECAALPAAAPFAELEAEGRRLLAAERLSPADIAVVEALLAVLAAPELPPLERCRRLRGLRE